MADNNCLSFTDLESRMRGQKTLGGFDVLVSYGEDELNALLKLATEKDNNTHINVPDFEAATVPQWPKKESTNYKISLEITKPNFTFAGPTRSTQIALSFEMGGNIYVQNADKTWGEANPVPAGMRLVVTSQLSTVTGSVHADYPNSGFVPVSPPSNPGGDNAVSFDLTKAQTSAIVIYIPKASDAGGQVDIVSDGVTPVSDDEALFMKSLIKTSMEEYFAQRPWNYYLALVNNKSADAPKVDNTYMLQPTSFGFSVSAGSDKVDNAICMWITVAGGSGRAVLQPGSQCNADFSVANVPRRPIPIGNGSNASIIFSHDLIQDILFKPSLVAKGCTELTDAQTPSGGLGMTFKLPSAAVHHDGKNIHNSDYGFGWSSTETQTMDAVDFNMNANATTLTVNPGLSVAGTPDAAMSWTCDTLHLNWENSSSFTSASPHGGTSYSGGNGTTDMVFSFSGSGTWVNPATAGSDSLQFSWKLPSNFNITATAETKDLNWWQSLWSSWKNTVPTDYASLTVPLPEISLADSAVDYFLTTNLLLPGQHVFVADPLQAASESDGIGIAVPCDVILTGKVSTSIQAARPASRVPLMLALAQNAAMVEMQSTSRPLKPSAGLTAADFIKMVCTFPTDSIMGPLLSAAASTVDNAGKVRDILEHNGYANLKPDELLAAMGTNTREALAPPTVTPPETPKHDHADRQLAAFATATVPSGGSVPAFDVRLFSGKYDITDGPAGVKGDGKLFLSPADGSITMDGQTVLPEVTTDTLSRFTTVTWTTSVGAYSVNFRSLPDDQGLFISSFNGKTVPSGGSEVNFSGKQSASEKPIIPDKNWEVINLVGFIFGTSCGIAGIVMTVVSCMWRKTDMRNQAEAARADVIVRRQAEQMQNRMQQMDTYFVHAAKKEAAKENIDWSIYKDTMSSDVEAGIKTEVDKYSLDDLQAMLDSDFNDANMDADRKAKWENINREGEAAAKATVESVATTAGEAHIVQGLAPFIQAGYITDVDAARIFKTSMQPEMTARERALKRTTDGTPSYLTRTMQSLTLKRIAELEVPILQEHVRRAAEFANSATVTQSEIDAKSRDRQKRETEIKEAKDLDPESDTSALEREAESLQRDIDTLAERKKTESDNAAEQRRLQEALETKRREDHDREVERKRDAEQAIDHALEGH